VEVISDFRVLADQRELSGPVASVPTAWRALSEIAADGQLAATRITAAVNAAISGIAVADQVLDGAIAILSRSKIGFGL
jgi:hypothetical protein